MKSVWWQFVSGDFQWPFVFLVGMSVLLCLTAVWAVVSPRYWFWRALAVWGAFALLLPIRAWDPAWMFGLAMPVMIVVVGGVRWSGGGSGSAREGARLWRFTLRDLLLLLLIVSLWMPVVLQVVRAFQPHNWYGWLASSGAIAVVALLAVARAYTQREPIGCREWMLLGAEFLAGLWLIGAYQQSVEAFGTGFLVVVALGGMLVWRGWSGWRQVLATLVLVGAIPLLAQGVLKAGYWVVNWGPLGSSAFKPAEKIGMIALFALELAWGVIGILLLAVNARLANPTQLLRSREGRVISVLVSAWAIGMGVIYVNLLTIRPAPVVATFTTSANHYERVMAIAGRAVILSPCYESIGSVRKTTPKAADELEALCQELMPLLEAPNYVPYIPGDNGSYTWLCNNHHAVQMLPHILLATSNDYRAVQQFDEAAVYLLAIIRLGDMQCRGGLESDFNTGTLIRRRGLRALVEMQKEISSEGMRKVLAALQLSIDGREDPEIGWARWLRYRQDSWDGWALNLERVLCEEGERRQFMDDTLRHERQQELGKRLLLAEMAVRFFVEERGEAPEKLSELVPDYLVAVPVDLNGQPLELRKKSDGGWAVQCREWGGVRVGGGFLDPPRFPQVEGFGVDLDYLSRQQF
jgi:hypothetical protein